MKPKTAFFEKTIVLHAYSLPKTVEAQINGTNGRQTLWIYILGLEQSGLADSEIWT